MDKESETPARPTDRPTPADHTLQVQQLFVQHQGRLRAFVLSLTPDFATAEDVIQETFLIVTRKAAEFAPGTNFPAWARRIAVFTLLSHIRDRQRGPLPLAADVLEALAAAAPPDDDEARHLQEISLLRNCLERLAPAARELVRLRYFGEHLPEEIAQMRSQSVNAINVTLSRARATLRQCMERRLHAAHLQP
jgi:RNA polymerase sigma-70 factor (ECF subfamily)